MKDNKGPAENAGSICSICISKENGGGHTLPVRIERAVLQGGQGIAGDVHGSREGRGLVFLDAKAGHWMKEAGMQGLCFSRFHANFLTEGLDYAVLKEGDLISAGTALIEITKIGKRCFDECARMQHSLECMLRDHVFFARVLKGGTVIPGDGVSFFASADQGRRYSRQLMVSGLGICGQMRIAQSSAIVIGAGGLGCPVITALASAGVGRIGIADKEEVELSNLNRQYLYLPDDIGKRKAKKAGEWVSRFRPDCRVDVFDTEVTRENAEGLIKDYDIVLLALDTVSARMVLNTAAVRLKKPLVEGAADGFYGSVTARLGEGDPCLACVNPKGREPVKNSGAFSPVTMLIGAFQAQTALRYLAGLQSKGGMWSYDGSCGCFEEVPIQKNPDCKVCRNQV